METNLQKYLAFCKTAELGSFSRAAEALAYSQSGVSRMIRDLEQEWGVLLLERGKGGVQLTSDGLHLLPYAQALCDDLRAAQAEAAALQGLTGGLIRIGTFSSAATHWLPPMIRAFQAEHPGIEYELLLGDYTEIERWVRCGRVDCGFLRLPAADPALEAVYLERDELMAVLPAEHPLAQQAVFPIEALQDAPFLLLEKGAHAQIARVLEQNHIRPNVRFTTWDDYAIMAMVECGLGVSILPKLILRRAPYRIAVRPLSVPAYRELGLVLRSRQNAPLAVNAFLKYLPFRNGPGAARADGV